MEASLSKAGIPIANMGALQEKLLDGTDEEKRAVKELLGLYEARENLTKKIASQEDKAIKDRIQAVEGQIERERVLGMSPWPRKKRLRTSFDRQGERTRNSLRRKIKELTKAEKKAELDAAKTACAVAWMQKTNSRSCARADRRRPPTTSRRSKR